MRNEMKHFRATTGNREYAPQSSNVKPANRRLRGGRRIGRGWLESLEDRRVLAGDVLTGGEAGGIVPPDFLPGTVYGRKWEDLNGDGRASEDEPGLTGVQIYADLNQNGQYDANEPSTRSQVDDPTTRVDETGNYVLEGVPAGRRWIREVVPQGFVQTYPQNLPGPGPLDPIPVDEPLDPAGDEFTHVEPPELLLNLQPGETFVGEVSIAINPFCIRAVDLDVVSSDPAIRVENFSGVQVNGCGGDTSFFKVGITADHVPTSFKLLFVDTLGGSEYGVLPVYIEGSGEPLPGDAHVVYVAPGEAVTGIDFGNLRVGGASIEGRKWLDRDGDGQQAGGEVGQAGVSIYLDLNRDGQWNRNEPMTVTGSDIPETDFDEGGLYRFDGLKPGDYLVREIVPANYVQTYPGVAGIVLSSETGALQPGVALDLDVTAVSATQSDAAIPDSLAAKLSLTVVWPDSCGALIEGATSATVVGDHIIVSLAGQQVGDFCAEVISPETTTVEVDGLHSGVYDVIVVLSEDLRDGQARTNTLTTVAQVEVGGPGAYLVSLSENEVVSEINFGNYSTLRPGSIHGLKWLDANGNGQRDRDELGLAGVTIYVDENHNTQWDRGEPSAVTLRDNPATAVDETGQYVIDGIEPAWYEVREVVPEGYLQTYPGNWLPIDPIPLALDALIAPFPQGSHWVQVPSGGAAKGIDFGNQPIKAGAISGVKWLDANGDGQRDRGELGLAGVTIYVDLNHNSQWDADEPTAVTRRDDPNTRFDETGSYQIEGLRPGMLEVREVVPEGYQQTFPYPWIAIDLLPPRLADVLLGAPLPDFWPITGGSHWVVLPSGGLVEGLDFGNQRIPQGAAVAGVTWVDEDRDGKMSDTEDGLPGVVVYADLNHDGRYDVGEPATRSHRDDPSTPENERGRYLLEGLRPGDYLIREVQPAGYLQTFPLSGTQILNSRSEDLPPGSALDFQLVSASGSTRDGIPGGELTFEVVWRNGCGSLLHDNVEVDVDADAIRVVLAGTQVGQICTQALRSESITVSIPEPPAETYVVRGLLRESAEPNGPLEDSFLLRAVVSTGQRGGHAVTLAAGETRRGLDFGNRQDDDLPPPGVGPIVDFDGDGELDVRDIDALAAAIRSGKAVASSHDLSGDGKVNQADYQFLVETIMDRQFGDSNLDGVFNSSDLVKVFQDGLYESKQPNSATWEQGDWNGDGRFDTADLVAAFQRSHYDGGTSAIAAETADAFWELGAALDGLKN